MPNTTERQPLPEWLTETPVEHHFYLIAEERPTGTWAQDVPLTREEYETLKHHLAELRGHLQPA